MLVKCISYIITVFGTKRYKPVLFTCVALLLSLGGIAGANSLYNQPQLPETAASAVTENDKPNAATSEALSKQGLRFEDTSTPQDVPAAQEDTQEPATTTPSTTSPSSSTATSTSAFSIAVAETTITLSKSATSAQVTFTATTSNNAAAYWTANFDNAPQGLVVSQTESGAASSVGFQLKLTESSQVQPGNYRLLIAAKDAAGTSVTKAITVTVTQ